jgi:hypothetical protein
MKIGNIQCPASACADDITINNTNLEEAQILLNMVYDYNCKEHYKLQPQKSVVIDMSSQKKRGKSTPNQLQLDGTNLQNVEKTAHSERICFTILLWNFSSFSRFFLSGVITSRPYNKVGMTYVLIIAKRQLSVKSGQSNSWFIYAKNII